MRTADADAVAPDRLAVRFGGSGGSGKIDGGQPQQLDRGARRCRSRPHRPSSSQKGSGGGRHVHNRGLLVAHVLLLLQLVDADGPQSSMTPTMIHIGSAA
jgi:hypothetical protein